LVTSKERTSTSARAGAFGLLFSAAVMVFVLLFGGTASAEIDDQSSDTTNSGAGVANTGANGAGGNESGNTASGDQTATASGAGDDSVAPNQGGASNASTGSANVHTGDATATGNSASNNTQQTVVSGHNGAVVLVDQDATITNNGVGVANTGFNTATGNASQNVSTADQTATATGTDEGVAANTSSVRNSSGGDARVTTGDADATGNDVTNNVNQTFDGNYSGLGVVVIVDQNVDVNNSGVGIANSGLNTGLGNNSSNDASTNQDADATGSVSANNGTASTNSTGSADIMTGDATATGNAATNNVSQIANVTATGRLGSIVLIDQDADVNNTGIALANTGLNTATGNTSESTSNAVQGAVSGAGPPADDSVASNNGIASTDSNGTAGIHTGHANAVGNSSHTNLTQVVNVDTAGHGIVLTDQTADVSNTGVGIANTGGNEAVGNTATSFAAVDQDADSATLLGDDAVAANFGTASTTSNGSASIHTGNANGIGNQATTNISQTANADTSGGLFLPDQDATVTNAGVGIANTGLNEAVGNASPVNTAVTTQNAVVGDAAESAVAANFGEALTNSDGDATIDTGHANAIGNDSAATTNIAQTASASGSDLVLSDQTVDVTDNGVGIANTGLNQATGNESTSNEAAVDQTATADDAGDDAVASNFGSSLNNSNGSADITTGNAHAVGSSSHTDIAQTIDAHGGGLLVSDQEVNATNSGVGIANTGVNDAIGNTSTANGATVNQTATVPAGASDDTVAANFATSSTSSDGSASIDTGAANAVGSRTTTNVAQTVDFSGENFALVDQEVDAANSGVGIANTGLNTAIGNASNGSSASVDQAAGVAFFGFFLGVDADDIVASNDGQATTHSDGSADITTGDAIAVGNDSHSTFAQTADVNTDAGFALVDQEVTETNNGVGIANTGINTAVGNESSTDVSGANQSAGVGVFGIIAILDADDVAAVNTAITNVSSDGDADIHTGRADGYGNTSTTAIAQTADANITGNGFALYDQDVDVTNSGVGIANSGLNEATGNISTNNVAPVNQDAGVGAAGIVGFLVADDVVATNLATTNVNSNGSARITTGDACAYGNESSTAIAQTADANFTGTGFVLLDQEADVVNNGAAIANSGLNTAVGNSSFNSVGSASQDASAGAFGFGAILSADDVVAANTAISNTVSNGSAGITTGLASANGNTANTAINQVSDTNIDGGGFVLADQDADVTNLGVGIANSGINTAIGNDSTNSVCGANTPCEQNAFVGASGFVGSAFVDDAVAANIATYNNNSDGTATITTGDACACGNVSNTTINQGLDANIDGSGFVLADQDADVTNTGVGIANTGINNATGNSSTNTATFDQNAAVGDGAVLVADDVVATNLASSNNVSDGSADINTGNATGLGNVSTSGINQGLDANITGTGFVLSDQDADVVNTGSGLANTGLNEGIGNDSTNSIASTQDADIVGAGVLDDGVAANVVVGNNISTGSVDIDSGDAYALGNLSATGIAQAASHPGDGLFLADQTDSTTNLGVALANSGFNTAAGNTSTNTTTNTATATAPGEVASNTAELNNFSDGLAHVRTGDAFAIGNSAANSSCQGINAPVDCPVPALPIVPPKCACKRPVSQPPVVNPPDVTPPVTPPVVPPVVPGDTTPPGAVLARTGVAVGVQVMLGLLLLAIGAFLRRRARTA